MKILINDLMQFSDLPDDLKSPSLDDAYPNTGTLFVNFTIPAAYAQFDVIDGVPSQPLSVYSGLPISGVPSQPLAQNLEAETLVDDIGNILVDDVGNVLYDLSGTSGAFIPGVPSQPLSVSGANEFNCLGIGGTDATQIIINGDIILTSEGSQPFKAGLYELGQTVKASQMTIDHNGTFMGRIAAGVCSEMCISPTREVGFYTTAQPRQSISLVTVPAAGGAGGEVIGVDFRYKIDRDIYTEFQRAYVTQIMQGYPFFMDFNNDKWLPRNKFYGATDNEMIFQSSINGFKYSRRFEFSERF